MTNKPRGTLYIGVTDDLVRRICEHRYKLMKGFTRQYNLDKLVYYEEINSAQKAIAREKQLKNWHCGWKINLIEKMNPEWKDLFVVITNRDPETSSGVA
jgi:putative endonuclease